jgi:hypothetical protein
MKKAHKKHVFLWMKHALPFSAHISSKRATIGGTKTTPHESANVIQKSCGLDELGFRVSGAHAPIPEFSRLRSFCEYGVVVHSNTAVKEADDDTAEIRFLL